MKGRDTDMKRLIVAISGATGVQMGARLLEVLHHMPQVETHLVISRGAEVIFQRETSIDLEELKKLADYTYDVDNLAAAISSGSYRTDGMIILPCSMKTLSGLANAYDEDLIVRAAPPAPSVWPSLPPGGGGCAAFSLGVWPMWAAWPTPCLGPSPRERGSRRTSAPSAAPDTRMCMPPRRWQSSCAWPPTRRCASVPGCIWTTPARRKLKR